MRSDFSYDCAPRFVHSYVLTASRSTDKERDSETGLDDFGARYYASNMGRWLSPDWANKPEAVPHSSLDDPQSLNLYQFVRNYPLSNRDSDGHSCPPDCSNPWFYFTGAVGEALNIVPDTLNLAPRAFNFVSDKLGRPQMGTLDRIEPDARSDSQAGARAVSDVLTVVAVVAPVAAPLLAPEAEEATASRSAPSEPTVPESIPAGPSARPTAAQQKAINEMGEAHGCSTCTATTPGT
jgi:RHS repeat-associated protein